MMRDAPDRIDQQPLVVVLEHAVLGRTVERVLREPDEDHQAPQQPHLAGKRVELRIAHEAELLDRLAGEVARQHDLHLARDRLLVDLRKAARLRSWVGRV